jgi:7,8-dihydroneopterin aldolase/epimerase/oxygenase
MDIIEIENMEFYARHGHFSDEQVVGNYFLVDVSIETDCTRAALSDRLHDALDYQQLYAIIKEEMHTPSKLLEHLCRRILDRFYGQFPEIGRATIKIKKMNPPIGGKVGSVSVMMTK